MVASSEINSDKVPGPQPSSKKLTEDNGDGTFTIPEWLAVEKGIV